MAGITLAQAEAQLALFLAAEAAVLNNQRYKIGDRELERADLAEIRDISAPMEFDFMGHLRHTFGMAGTKL